MAKRKYKQNNKGAIIGLTISALLIAGTGTLAFLSDGFTNWDTSTWFQEEKKAEDNLDTEIESKGIKLKLLTTNEAEDGSITKTFNYTITPANATNQNVTATAKYKDGTSCSSVLTTSVNSTDKTISIVCKSAFAQQIEVVVTSEANENAKATIKVDYVKKLLSIESKQASTYFIGNGYEDKENYLTNLNVLNFINPVYSIYSKDKTYTFEVYEKYPSSVYALCGGRTLSDNFKNSFAGTYFDNILLGYGEFSYDTIWNNCQANNNDKSILKQLSDATNLTSHYIGITSSFKVRCVEDKTIKNDSMLVSFNYSCQGAYSDKTVGVDSLNVEVENIEF